jgi:hypothetical protein
MLSGDEYREMRELFERRGREGFAKNAEKRIPKKYKK